ncbi:hypothetical protein AWH48_11495 [Domibacillus aminovorans]|uniref:PIN like domain-containing protein n=1 Tax=Domibacillus aminovorans TaxID=29332 RepID=A0A177KLA3_9BACI|nr:PIN-like domain-containing protein [Domibacillus aminovorans]OAH53887.1 hypothetical protein AWH48_11495 [Domibacillus aminovorans]
MKEWEAYFHQPKPVNELIKSALIVVDTNVLLAAYQWREVTVNEMVNALEKLSNEKRLRIPLQVIQEFSKNRPQQLIQRINDIETLISGLQSHKSLNQKVPMLEGKEVYEEAIKLQEQYNKATKDYKDGLIKLRYNLKGLFSKDSYLESLKEIIDKSFFSPGEQESVDKLIEKAQKRFKDKIPPGFKDSEKEENNAGDFIIWDFIMKLQSDVIFISGDKKTDWVYSDGKKNPISARRELVEEFYRETGGKDFVHLSPKEFITLLNPEVSEEVKEDLSTELSSNDVESEKHGKIPLRTWISNLLFEYDPMWVVYDQDTQTDEYVPEAWRIYDFIENGNFENDEEFNAEVRNILQASFGTDVVISVERFQEMLRTLYVRAVFEKIRNTRKSRNRFANITE